MVLERRGEDGPRRFFPSRGHEALAGGCARLDPPPRLPRLETPPQLHLEERPGFLRGRTPSATDRAPPGPRGG